MTQTLAKQRQKSNNDDENILLLKKLTAKDFNKKLKQAYLVIQKGIQQGKIRC